MEDRATAAGWRCRRIGQKAMHNARHIDPRQYAETPPGASEYMIGDEAPERLAESGALVRDDGGMRNWNAQGGGETAR